MRQQECLKTRVRTQRMQTLKTTGESENEDKTQSMQTLRQQGSLKTRIRPQNIQTLKSTRVSENKDKTSEYADSKDNRRV